MKTWVRQAEEWLVKMGILRPRKKVQWNFTNRHGMAGKPIVYPPLKVGDRVEIQWGPKAKARGVVAMPIIVEGTTRSNTHYVLLDGWAEVGRMAGTSATGEPNDHGESTITFVTQEQVPFSRSNLRKLSDLELLEEASRPKWGRL